SGDTLSQMAYRYQVKEDDLLALNRIYDRNALSPGDTMRIPAYGHVRAANAQAGRGGGRGQGTGRATGRAGVRTASALGRPGALERTELPPPGDASYRDASYRNISYVPVPQRRPGPLNPPYPQRRPGAQTQRQQAQPPQPAQQASWLEWIAPADSRVQPAQ